MYDDLKIFEKTQQIILSFFQKSSNFLKLAHVTH